VDNHGPKAPILTLECNEPLLTVTLNATAATTRTHEDEKLEALYRRGFLVEQSLDKGVELSASPCDVGR
jgi:hypothetical protein